MSGLSARALLISIAALSLGSEALALVLQYRFDMQPCPWCVLQRVIYTAIAIVALLGLLSRAVVWRRGIVLLLLALCAAGISAATWQHFVAASSASCDLTLAERIVSALKLDEWLPEVFTAWASCKDAAVKLLGVPFEIWSLSLYLVLSGLALLVWRR